MKKLNRTQLRRLIYEQVDNTMIDKQIEDKLMKTFLDLAANNGNSRKEMLSMPGFGFRNSASTYTAPAGVGANDILDGGREHPNSPLKKFQDNGDILHVYCFLDNAALNKIFPEKVAGHYYKIDDIERVLAPIISTVKKSIGAEDLDIRVGLTVSSERYKPSASGTVYTINKIYTHRDSDM